MTISRNLFLPLFICSIFAYGNNNIKTYEVNFPCGSSFVSEAIKIQAAKIYNEIPELQFAKIKVKGSGEDHYSDKTRFLLAKERTNHLIEFYKLAGCSSKDLKLSFSTLPHVLIFKPKSKLVSTSVLKEEFIQKKIQRFEINSSKDAVVQSENNCLYLFEGLSFETEAGTLISRGTIQIDLVEIQTMEDILFSGIMGNTHDEVLSPKLFYRIEAFYKGEQLQLKQYAKVGVYVLGEIGREPIRFYHAQLDEGILNWEPVLKEEVIQKNLLEEELSAMGIKLTQNEDTLNRMLFLQTDHLNWGLLAFKHNKTTPVSFDFKVKSSEDFSLFICNDELGIILPVYKNLSYINRYQLKNVPKEGRYIIRGIPINSSSKAHINTVIEESKSHFSFDVSDCQSSHFSECFLFRD